MKLWRPHPHCRRSHELWVAPDGEGTETDVTRFLAALVAVIKPSIVIETGTYLGTTSAEIATALRQNGRGRLVTYESDPDRASAARERLAAHENVTVVASAVDGQNLPRRIDVAFLDSCMTCRAAEMRLVWPRVTPGGIVLVHDAAPARPPGKVRPRAPFAFFEFATPRGLNAFQKPWPT